MNRLRRLALRILGLRACSECRAIFDAARASEHCGACWRGEGARREAVRLFPVVIPFVRGPRGGGLN